MAKQPLIDRNKGLAQRRWLAVFVKAKVGDDCGLQRFMLCPVSGKSRGDMSDLSADLIPHSCIMMYAVETLRSLAIEHSNTAEFPGIMLETGCGRHGTGTEERFLGPFPFLSHWKSFAFRFCTNVPILEMGQLRLSLERLELRVVGAWLLFSGGRNAAQSLWVAWYN